MGARDGDEWGEEEEEEESKRGGRQKKNKRETAVAGNSVPTVRQLPPPPHRPTPIRRAATHNLPSFLLGFCGHFLVFFLPSIT